WQNRRSEGESQPLPSVYSAAKINVNQMPVPAAISNDLSTHQLLLTTLLVKLAVMAASATILVRFRRFRHFLIFEHRPSPDRLAFALSLGILLSAGVAARLLLH